MTEQAQRIVDAYKVVDGEALNERKLWLQDDYVKFIRLAQTLIERAGAGVFGYITNHGYLDNPTFRGMRQSLMGTFGAIRVLDLHGNANKQERSPDGSEDNNVFEIRQGVAICMATRSGAGPLVEHGDLWGRQETKYSWLATHGAANTPVAALSPDSPYYFFEPQNTDWRAEYDAGWKISEAMPVNSAGFITARDHFVIDFDRDALLARIEGFADPRLGETAIREKYFAGYGSDKYPDGDTRGWKVPQARRLVQNDKKWKERTRPCRYRPFDVRWIYWADWMVDWPRPEVMGHMLAGPNLALHVCRQSISESWAHVLATRELTDDCYVSNKTKERGYTHPLYLYRDSAGLALGPSVSPNFAPAFVKALSGALGLEQAGPHRLPRGVEAEDIFNYAYAVLHSPTYRSRYGEFLKIDFPRLPLLRSRDAFHELAQLGGELVAFHLLESKEPVDRGVAYEGPARPEVEKVSFSDGTVWIDRAQSRGFRQVPEAVWGFHIGGYRVCEKWLKDRKGRELSKEEVAMYRSVLIAVRETMRIMDATDKVIAEHGGWPGAFGSVSGSGDASAHSRLPMVAEGPPRNAGADGDGASGSVVSSSRKTKRHSRD